MRRIALTVLAVLALAGCSGPADTGTPSSTPAPSTPASPSAGTTPPATASPDPATGGAAAVSAPAWVGQVCSAIAPASQYVAPPQINAADLAGSRDQLLTYLDGRARAVETGIQGLSAAGAAPVPDGQAATAAAGNVLRGREAVLQAARAGLAAVPADNPQFLAGGLQAARSQLVAPSPATLADLGVPAPLIDTARSVPQCQGLLGPA